jgi:hypothetical protein
MVATAAIQHARAVNADRHCQHRHLPFTVKLELKRLWWSCIIRDRVLALGLRQSIHIGGKSFQFEAEKLTLDEILSGQDIESHEAGLGWPRAMITIALCGLRCIIIDVVTLTIPQN